MSKGRTLFSYRTSLVMLVPTLVVATGGVIGASSYVTTRSTIHSLTDRLFTEVSSETVRETQSHLGQARPAVDMLATILGEGEPNDADIEARLLAVARANPSFAWVSYGDRDGRFVGVHRLPNGDLIVNRSEIVAGKTQMREERIEPNGGRTLVRQEGDTGYDPRARPFYKDAAERQGRIFTQPYVFFDEGIPGITCARPVMTKNGELRGVVTVDFDLNVLSKFARTLELSKHSQVFIYTDDGALVAHSRLEVVGQTGKRLEGSLVKLESSGDPVLPKVAAEPRNANAGAELNRIKLDNGEVYLSSVAPINVDDRTQWHVGVVAPESDFTEALEKNNQRALGISLAAVGLAVALAIWMAGRVARPLERIAGEMRRAGELDVEPRELPTSPFREIETMRHALLGMKSGLRSFVYFVPRDVVRLALASGQEAALGGKLRELTIFFSDIAGFTTLAEKTPPNDLVLLLGDYFDDMTKVIADHGGTVDKFIGDGIMAFWNAPTEDNDHATHGALAALASLEKLAARAKQSPELAGIKMRIGIATGEVLVGNIGSTERMNYTVMGDHVNLAARLEGLNKTYGSKILVSEATKTAASSVLMRPVDVVAVKGKKQGVRVYEPLAPKESATPEQRKTVSLCDAALDAYLDKRFDAAYDDWQAVLAIVPDDPVAQTMSERAKQLAASPPAEWDGVFVATEK